MDMTDHKELGRRLAELRTAARVSQAQAAQMIEVSQPTYSRIETGDRPLKGAELVMLADLLQVRASAITGVAQLRQHATSAARTTGSSPQTGVMRDKLFAYLELDAYLSGQGIATA